MLLIVRVHSINSVMQVSTLLISNTAGTSKILLKYPGLRTPIDDGKEDETTKTVCNKDTGEKKRIQRWTRGVWMSVSGGGIIQSWQPLYKYV